MPPAAEPGQTTSEWKLVVGTLVGLVLTALARWGLHPSPDVVAAINDLTWTAVATVASYALSRGIRKAGTPG